MTATTLHRQVFGEAAPVASEPAPTPTVERIPRMTDGSTWHAYAETASGARVGACARTKRAVLVAFSEQWARFA